MRVKKAIKRIAALGAGATMLGATLTGAMAADLNNYPGMFIEDGQFNGLLVVGENADAIDTIGMTNIALGLQQAAVTETVVCGSGSTTTTSVSGEKVQIERSGDKLNIGEKLYNLSTTGLDDGDLPTILADGEYDENEGNQDNDVTYSQKIDFGTTTGDIVFAQDDTDAPEAGVYLNFPKNKDIYTYTLDFDDNVEYDSDPASTDDDDFESSVLEIQGQKYTITDIEYAGTYDAIEKFTLMAGESVAWISQGETVTKEIDGVEHTVTMIDVNADADSCGFSVDGSTVWIDKDSTETVNGVTLGVTDALAVYSEAQDNDMCKVFIGAAELVLEDGKEVELEGDDVDGSLVTISSSVSGDEGTWTELSISYDPEDDLYLAAGDEWVDPVFGNFKFIMGGEVASFEELVLDTSGADATLTFNNFDEQEVVIPWAMDEDNGNFVLGEDPDLAANPEDGFYLQGDVCDPTSDDVTDCAGAEFLVVTSGDVAHVIEITSMSDPSNSDPEIDFKDITTGTTSDNNDYGNGADDCTEAPTGVFACTFDLGSDAGDVVLTIDTRTGNEDITFTTTDNGDIKTENEGILDISSAYVDDTADTAWFFFTENNDEENEAKINVTLGRGTGSDDDTIEIQSPVDAVSGSGSLYGPVDKSDALDDTDMYYTHWGSIIEYESEDKHDFSIQHPEEQLYVEAYVAETSATTTVQEGAGEGCTTVTTTNPIPSTVNKFDTEVSNYQSQNVISIGGPCANSVSSALLGNPEVCYEGFEEGKSILQLFENGDNVALLVAGATGKDTRAASKVLQNYGDYDLSGSKMEVTTVSMQVEPFTETEVVEEEEETAEEEEAEGEETTEEETTEENTEE